MNQSENPQAVLWNGRTGQFWVEEQDLLNAMFAPLAERLAGAVEPGEARRVLDIGCGTGATTRAMAARLGAGGSCTGVDISAPMIAAARARAEAEGIAGEYVLADAAAYAFPAAGFDRIVSRFGVMFFADPVAAFQNLRRAAAPGAVLHVIAWRAAAENPFMTVAEQAAAGLLPNLQPRVPGAPGQFAFADGERVREMLTAAGWGAVTVRAIDPECALPAARLPDYYSRMGPVGQALVEADAATREQVLAVVGRAFEPFVVEGKARFRAACWEIGAASL